MNLAIKIHGLTLAQEARLIRRKENAKLRQAKYAKEKEKLTYIDKIVGDRLSLYHHRIMVVRPEARAAHLAYGFLIGKPYSVMENMSYTYPDWKRIEALITKHGEGDTRTLLQHYSEWRDEALKRPLIPRWKRALKNSDRKEKRENAEMEKDGIVTAALKFLGITH